MKVRGFLINLGLVISLLIFQMGEVMAAPASQDNEQITGTIQAISLETDPSTGIITLTVTLIDKNQSQQTIRLSQQAAEELGLITLDDDAKRVINELLLGEVIEIDAAAVLQDEARHPVGNALATIFSEITGLDYETIMAEHARGAGFGVIAQALWLTNALPEGSLEDFKAILRAKETNVYTAFMLENGTTPSNWGQLRKAILDGRKIKSLSAVVSNPGALTDEPHSDHEQERENNRDNKQKEKSSNGNPPEKEKDKQKNK